LVSLIYSVVVKVSMITLGKEHGAEAVNSLLELDKSVPDGTEESERDVGESIDDESVGHVSKVPLRLELVIVKLRLESRSVSTTLELVIVSVGEELS
jgi:hypothetical protein